jgi:hypothetical protein
MIIVGVAGRAVAEMGVASKAGLAVACGRGYGSLAAGAALGVEATVVRGTARGVTEVGAAVMALVRVGRRKEMVEVALARGEVQEESNNSARRNQVTRKRLIFSVTAE